MAYEEDFYEGLLAIEREAHDSSWMPRRDEGSLGELPASGSCRQAVFCSKPAPLLHSVLGGRSAPLGCAIFHRNALLSVDEVRRIREETAGVPLIFVGDLSPRHLAIYLSLRVGGVGGTRSDEVPVDVRYAGIDDAWLAECERRALQRGLRNDRPEEGGRRPYAEGDWCGVRRRAGYNWAWAELEAYPVDLIGLRWLEAGGMDWESVVGPTCMAMLRSGWNLELEGATNPTIYDAGFPHWIERHVFGACDAGE